MRQNNNGMTLLEVVLALMVFTVVAGGLFTAFAYSARMDRRALLHALATYTAQMKLEEAYGGPPDYYVDLNDDTGPVTDVPELEYSFTVNEYDPTLKLYTVSVTVYDIINAGVSVTYEDLMYAFGT